LKYVKNKMITKNIYFIRHGETTSNLEQTWRTANESVTERGLEQARVAAKRVKQLPVTKIVTSTASRTLETAKIIGEETGLPVEEDKLFYKEKTPTSIQGLKHEKTPGNRIEQYIQALLDNSEDPEFHFEDEENLWQRRERIKAIISYLERQREENLLVVTHGNILKMLMAYIVLGKDCSAKEMYLSSQKFKTENTGISQVILENGEWRILIWNDHAHFAETI